MITNPSARVQIRKINELRNPAVCALCGNGTCLDGYVDPDVYFEWEGNVYFCMNCAKEQAQAIGCLLPAESKHLEELNVTIAEELRATKEKLNDYKQFDNLIHQYFGKSLISLTTDPVTDGNTGSADEQEHVTESPGSTDSGESEPAEPVTSSRPVHVKRPTASNKPQLNI